MQKVHSAGFFINHLSDTKCIRMRYQVYRSLKDRSLHVLHYEDRFLQLPDTLRHRGPWQGLKAGDVVNLRPEYQGLLSERGHVVIEQSTGALSVEESTAADE